MSSPRVRIRPVEDIVVQIKRQVQHRDKFWNNLVTLYLKQIHREHGKEATLRVIQECGLFELGWAQPPSHVSVQKSIVLPDRCPS